MGDKNISAKEKLDQQANAWFDQVDDRQLFDAFGTSENKRRIGDDIFTRIEADIHRKKSRVYFFMKVAASLLIAAISITTYRLVSDQQSKKNHVALIIYKSGSSELKKVSLSDGSIIWMNAATIIRVPSKFETNQRVVYLDEGEAFFEVKKNAAKPFFVYTNKLHTRVLGTSFNIKSYRQLEFTRVTVRTGRVQIGNIKQNLGVYTHNQQLTYDNNNGKFTRQLLIEDQSNSWRTGKVKLEQAGFEELAIALQAIYKIRLVTKDDSIKKLKYSLTMESTQRIEEALKLINAIHETKTRRFNNEIEILK